MRKYAFTMLLFLSLVLAFCPKIARAVPSFGEQTGQPCAACHVGAFGPQLKQYGREFKLNGFALSDGKNHGLPLAATAQVSLTHTNADQADVAAPHFARNDNVAVDQLSAYYGGRIAPNTGALVQGTFDGVSRQLRLDNSDVRHAREGELFDRDLVYGFTANNSPTVSDLWNSTPVWGFPYNGSALASAPLAAALIDGGLSQRVVGLGAYVSWNNLLYLEVDLYRGLGRDVLKATGNGEGSDLRTSGAIPYWRLALEQQLGRHYVQLGTYGLNAKLSSGLGAPSLGGRITDTALDANYQFTLDPKSVVSDMVSAHATLIHEVASLRGGVGDDRRTRLLDTFRADVSYSIAATVTSTVQYFQTGGRGDASYWATQSGKPNSSGIVTEIAYVPWGKPDSWLAWGNIRLAAQYVSYFRFDGQSHAASDKNALYVGIWSAAHF